LFYRIGEQWKKGSKEQGQKRRKGGKAERQKEVKGGMDEICQEKGRRVSQ